MKYQQNQLHQLLQNRPESYDQIRFSYNALRSQVGIAFSDGAGSKTVWHYIVKLDSHGADEVMNSVKEHCEGNGFEFKLISPTGVNVNSPTSQMLTQLKEQILSDCEDIFSDTDINAADSYSVSRNSDKIQLFFYQDEERLTTKSLTLGPLSSDSNRLTEICEKIVELANENGIENRNKDRSLFKILTEGSSRGR